MGNTTHCSAKGITKTNTHREKSNKTHQNSSLLDLIKYLHDAVFSPVPPTYIGAIENECFQSCQVLTEKIVRKYLPESVATVQGHLNQTRKMQDPHKS